MHADIHFLEQALLAIGNITTLRHLDLAHLPVEERIHDTLSLDNLKSLSSLTVQFIDDYQIRVNKHIGLPQNISKLTTLEGLVMEYPQYESWRMKLPEWLQAFQQLKVRWN